MIGLSIILDGDNAWPDLAEKGYVQADIVAVAILDSGMASGKPSVAIRIEHEGKIIIAQTSARLFCSAANAFLAKYPNLLED